jgi:ABC-2 type transport system permease protein
VCCGRRRCRIEGYLLRPLPLLTQVLLSTTRISAVGDLAVGGTILGISLGPVHTGLPPWKIVFLLITLVGAALPEGAVQLVSRCSRSATWTPARRRCGPTR